MTNPIKEKREVVEELNGFHVGDFVWVNNAPYVFKQTSCVEFVIFKICRLIKDHPKKKSI